MSERTEDALKERVRKTPLVERLQDCAKRIGAMCAACEGIGDMSLFDGQPLTPEDQERHRRNVEVGQGPTIRKQDWQGVWRTIRHKPWWMLLGKGPEGKRCDDCQFLRRQRFSKTYMKCGQQVATRGAGTDIRAKDEACRLFQEAS